MEKPAQVSSAEGLREQAHAAHRAGQLERAEQLYKRLLLDQGLEADVANLGALLRRQGRLGEAVELYRKALKRGAVDPTLISNAANAFRQSGELQASSEVLQQGLKQQPGHPAFLQGLAKTLLAQGQPAQAMTHLQQLLQVSEPSHELWFDLGVAQSRQGDLEGALSCFQRASQLEPGHVATAANRVTLLKELGRLDQARNALAEARVLALEGVELAAAEAGLLMAEQEMGEAAALFHALCQQQPLDPCLWLNLSACLRALKHSTLPARVVKAGLSLHPADHELLQALLQTLAEHGKLSQARLVLAEINRLNIPQKDSHFFNLQFLATGYGLLTCEEQQQMASHWEQRKQKAACDLVSIWRDYLPEPLQSRRLRVGYLSSDFCNHPVGRFLLPVLESHNRSAVELWGLHTGPHWDAVSDQIQQACEHWLDLREYSDSQAARMIGDQRLDVLVELGGYTGNSRVGICVHGVAPVQMSYLGYPSATFLKALPYWLGDRCLFSHLSSAQCSHHLLELDGGYMCFPRPAQAPLPDRVGSDRFRFASFNHARKLTDATLELWGELLKQAPEATLVLKSISFLEQEEKQRIRCRCDRFGIAKDQLLILPWAQCLSEHLAQYNQVDVALDPIPYGGATTTAEALWMGVPVVCLHGEGMVGSLSASLLHSAEQPQWIARCLDDYLANALNLMAEGIRQRPSRLKLIAQIQESPLNQPRRVSSQLESLFLDAALRQESEV